MSDNKNFTLPEMKIGSVSSRPASAQPSDRSPHVPAESRVRKTSFNIPVDIYRGLRMLAVQDDRHIGDIVEEALLDVLRKHGM